MHHGWLRKDKALELDKLLTEVELSANLFLSATGVGGGCGGRFGDGSGGECVGEGLRL